MDKLYCPAVAKPTTTDNLQPRLTFSTSDTKGRPMHKTFSHVCIMTIRKELKML